MDLCMSLGNLSFQHTVVVSPGIHCDMILGSDFLLQHGGVLDIARGVVMFGDVSVPLHVSGSGCPPSRTPYDRIVPRNTSPSCNSNTHTPHSDACSDDVPVSSYSSRVALDDELSVPAGHVVLVPCVYVDACSETLDCVADPLESFVDKFPTLSVTPALVTVGPDHSHIVMTIENHAEHNIIIHKNTNIAELSPLIMDDDDDEDDAAVSSVTTDHTPELTEQRKATIHEYVKSQQNLSSETKSMLTTLLIDNHDLFILHEDDYGYCDIFPHKIDTSTHTPIKQAARRIPYHRRVALQTLLDELLEKGIIQESISPWASPIVLVPKKNGSLRLCVDYRKLNGVTKPDAYPIPRVDDMLDSLSGCKWFSSLDLASGYWQIAMDPDDRAKTAFTTPLGLYEFTVLPMGCRNGPATFQRVMEAVLRGLCNAAAEPFCRVFFDDVLNASETLSGQVLILSRVFERVRSAGLRFNLAKCSFFRSDVAFLGHRVSADGISPDPDKVSAILAWKTPKSVTAVRSFLGFAGYYRRFIRGFAQRSAPLTALTGKNAQFVWTKACDASFRALKSALSSAPVMAFPDFGPDAGPFLLDTDASKVSIGGVLSQVQDQVERPIAFGGRIMSKAERNYDASDREALALVFFANHFRHYLLGREFTARTDNTALTALRATKEPRGRKARWIEALAEFEFAVVHRPGSRHRNADGLSRLLAEPEAHVHSESPPLAPTPPQDAAPSPPPSPPPLARDVPLSAADEMPLAADVPPAAEIIPPAVFVRPPGSSAAGPSSPDCFKPQSLLAPYADPALSECFTRYDAASGKFVRPPEAVSRPPDCQPPAVTASRPDPITLSDDDLPRCVPPLQPPSSDPVRTSSPVSRRSGRVRTAPARLADYVLD
eukprot:scpid17251/ scgid4942/ Retrovirus-related Pol polyprotein from transposon 17.6; Protease; Reverse transcriptase; Endonuclease